jgi:hypothetical protein
MPRSLTFRQYLAAWSKEATKGLIDRFGLLNLLVSFALWAWNRYSPTTLEATAKKLHLSASAAMSDWVWQLPLLVGVALVGYRFVRAPYEMHLQTSANGQDIGNRQAEDREIKDRAKRTGTFIADGVLLLRTAPQGQAAAEAIEKWKASVQEWTDNVYNHLAAINEAAVARFVDTSDMHAVEYLSISGAISSIYGVLQRRVQNLKDIIEKPEIYLT